MPYVLSPFPPYVVYMYLHILQMTGRDRVFWVPLRNLLTTPRQKLS
jgi:hypothetical protein